MDVSGDVADLMVKEGIQLTEASIKLLAAGSKNLAAFLWALAKDNKKLVGKRQTRVYYHLEDAGKEHLAALIKDYYKLTSAIESIINPRR